MPQSFTPSSVTSLTPALLNVSTACSIDAGVSTCPAGHPRLKGTIAVAGDTGLVERSTIQVEGARAASAVEEPELAEALGGAEVPQLVQAEDAVANRVIGKAPGVEVEGVVVGELVLAQVRGDERDLVRRDAITRADVHKRPAVNDEEGVGGRDVQACLFRGGGVDRVDVVEAHDQRPATGTPGLVDLLRHEIPVSFLIRDGGDANSGVAQRPPADADDGGCDRYLSRSGAGNRSGRARLGSVSACRGARWGAAAARRGRGCRAPARAAGGTV